MTRDAYIARTETAECDAAKSVAVEWVRRNEKRWRKQADRFTEAQLSSDDKFSVACEVALSLAHEPQGRFEYIFFVRYPMAVAEAAAPFDEVDAYDPHLEAETFFSNATPGEDLFEKARYLTLWRPNDKCANPIDKDVNFFVLALEALGAVPIGSCGGHPKGFYVRFLSSPELVLDLQKTGGCQVQLIEPRERLLLSEVELIETPSWTAEDRDIAAKKLAASWIHLICMSNRSSLSARPCSDGEKYGGKKCHNPGGSNMDSLHLFNACDIL